ncbi:hypothetical protein CI109_106936 [Kwoniella shandongensis]|uniref:Uncharacterized protein n=1 Tax=Kwoniella shandongensis TaxID=1734106 RepID=A0A5M6C7F8_9TREE|nr:uncharacterized protein CI109_000810 [Kwoniella shandongensis]KAA5530630.1 hypothetical protein CI109_000810 [Kwoniella shandongensis]
MIAATYLFPLLAVLGSTSAGVCRSKSSSPSGVLAVQTGTSTTASAGGSATGSVTGSAVQSFAISTSASTNSVNSSSGMVDSSSIIESTSAIASPVVATSTSSSAALGLADVESLAVQPESKSSSPATSLGPTSSEVVSSTSAVGTTSSASSPPPPPSSSSAPTPSLTTSSVLTSSLSSSSSSPPPPPTSSSPASSAAPTPSAVTTAKTKVGMGWPVQEKDAAPIAQFFTADSAVSWWYDWNKNWNQGLFNADGVTVSGEFIPMLYNKDFLGNPDSLQDGFTEIMGYNEPDLSTGGVSDAIDPAAAAEAWKTQITQIRQQYPDVKVHSPVVASNQKWLEDFFAAICPGASASNAWGDCAYKPDYVSMHIYTTDADYFKGTVQGYQQAFGLPLVLSEWACYDFTSKPNPSAEAVSTFMADTMAWMDQQDWLVKYAWFGAARSSDFLYGVAETNRLIDQNGQITALGKLYMAGGKA